MRRALGGGAARPKTFRGIGCDVANVDEVADAFRRMSSSGSGRIDILVQAAGVVGRTNLLTHRVL